MLFFSDTLIVFFNGIVVVKMSFSSKVGSPPEYIFVYFTMFLTPEPNSSAKPISLNTFAILGFLEYGENLLILISPILFALLAFSVHILSFSMISFAGNHL